jgi:predicted nicotinamide N-methyase
MQAAALREFVRGRTRPEAHPLVPEIRLRLAADVVGLWAATEALLGGGVRSPPFWAVAWPGGVGLARWLLDHPEVVAGRSVLDFGAGSGVAAIAAAKAGARAQVAEIDPLACAACEVNAEENGVAVEVYPGDPLAGGAWDVVVAGDVCYERPVAARILGWMRGLRDTTVILADAGRAFRPRDGVVEVGRFRIPVDRDVEGVDVREAVIWRLTPG